MTTMINLTEKKDTQFINADFEGGISVPTSLFTEKGRAEIKDAYRNFGSNLMTVGNHLVDSASNVYDSIANNTGEKSIIDTLVDKQTTHVQQIARSRDNRARDTLENADKGQFAENIEYALNVGSNDKTKVVSVEGSDVGGMYDQGNSQAYVNLANVGTNEEALIFTDSHERGHAGGASEDYANSLGETAVQSWNKYSSINSNYSQSGYNASNYGINTIGSPITQNQYNNTYNNTSALLQSNTNSYMSVPEGNRDYAYFAKRPLEELPWLGIFSENPIDDKTNTEISHEQLFFEDEKGGNIGFFGDGTERADDPKLLNTYRPINENTVHYDDATMREAVKNVKPKPYSLLGAGQCDKYNCQDYADDVRDEYNKLNK